jgi:hypothetical protein
MYAAACGTCTAELIACPIEEEAATGKFFWELEAK